ncbi:MAG: glycoside hydrolase family 6 protein [Candidatus Doudnabacteria bacterium]|nr:glycoside hydrolase family 6 protein [Candidatus Doudnabacteria bacterium]
MRFLRPHIKFLKFKTKRQFAKSAGIAILLTALVAITGVINFNSSAANLTSPNWDPIAQTWTTAGDWHNCDGSIDNDTAHHSFNLADTDPAHHMGMVCKNKKEAWSVQTPMPSSATEEVKAAFAEQPNPIAIVNDQPQVVAVQPEIAAVVPTPTISSSNNPFAGAKLYVNAYNDPSNYVRANQGTYNAQLMSKIASQPEVTWLGGWNSDISGDVARTMKTVSAQGALPVFVVYNIPNRDCGGYSSGGVSDAGSYRSWISQIANAIGGKKAVVILEPDALTLTDCLSAWQKSERFQMIQDAISTFKSKGTSVYLDAGHPNWLSASEMAARLNQAGIASADGFVLNIANFYTNDQNGAYGKSVSEKVGGKHFVVDTGRNGSGATADSQWCNPQGRSLGTPPTTSTGNSLIDAYLWVKGPGGSDGNCNGGPTAGTFWPEYALGLAQRTSW